MKIAWLVNNINQIGGIEQVVCGLSSYFSKEFGYHVEIVSINFFEDHLVFPLDQSVQVRHCGLNWKEETFRKLHKLVGEVMRNLDADFLLTCHSTISYAALLNKRKFKGKIIVTQHCANDFLSRKRLYVNALLFRLADRFVVLTHNDQRQYAKMKCKSQVIPNANYKPANVGSSLDQKIILAVGRIEAVKGFDMLIDAFSMVSPKHPDWKLCICGGGSCEQAISQQVKSHQLSDKVIFPGEVRNIGDYYRNASIFALSSRSEGFPFVLAEAMRSCG